MTTQSFNLGEGYSACRAVFDETRRLAFYWESTQEHVFSIQVPEGVELTPDIAKLMLGSYNTGSWQGKDRGKSEAQEEIRKALGISK